MAFPSYIFSIHLLKMASYSRSKYLFVSFLMPYRHRANARCCTYCMDVYRQSVQCWFPDSARFYSVCNRTKWERPLSSDHQTLFPTILHLCPTCCVSFYPLCIPSFTSPTCDIVLYTYFPMLHQSCVLLCVFYYNAPHMIKVLMAWDECLVVGRGLLPCGSVLHLDAPQCLRVFLKAESWRYTAQYCSLTAFIYKLLYTTVSVVHVCLREGTLTLYFLLFPTERA